MTPREIANKIRIAYPGASGYALEAADAIDTMLAALNEIAASGIPDQPASAAGDDLAWAQQHVARLRRIALNAMGAA